MRRRESRRSYLEPNRNRMLKTAFFQKVKRIADSYDPKKLPTEQLRGEMVLDLRVLLQIARKQASKDAGEKGPYGKEHRKWAKLAAYISKCINVIMRDYDAVKIKRKLDELTGLVRSELRERETEN